MTENSHWKNASDFIEDIERAEDEKELNKNVPVSVFGIYVGRYPKLLLDEPRESGVLPGKETHTSGLGSFLEGDIEYRGTDETPKE